MNLAMLAPTSDASVSFDDRRSSAGARPDGLPERRQFRDQPAYQHPQAGELAEAIDRYKLTHRRRFITCEELFEVITSLGYRKDE